MTSYDYQEALKNAARTMVRVKNPRRLLKMIVRFIVKEVGLTHASILMYDQLKSRYIFVDSKGDLRIPVSLVRLDRDNPLIRWFSSREHKLKLNKYFLSSHQIKIWLEDTQLFQHRQSLKSQLNELKDVMDMLKASVCVPGFYKDELLGVLLLGHKVKGESFSLEEISFFQTLANDASMTIKTAEYRENLLSKNQELEHQKQELERRLQEIAELRKKEQETYYQIVMSLAAEVNAKDPYTAGHLQGVERLGLMTAKEMGYDLAGHKKDVLVAALHLHDVGKIGIPDHILMKPAKLNEEEWKIMRQHPVKGAKILAPLTGFKEVANIVLHHHENYDGSGYPDGIKKDVIPIEARIVSVVDAFHAIVSKRCYSKGKPIDAAFEELKRCAGTQFDPQVVEAFIRAYKRTLNGKYQSNSALASDGSMVREDHSTGGHVSVPK
ncbi:MAG: HD domain-containing protein [Candidatus Omnitrophica bacterium]|nr:HD domain-containing protein [Candidatus Omnitrophota bacterium]